MTLATRFARRRHSKHKKYWARRRKNSPKKNRKRTRCSHCDDVRAGKHWKDRNQKDCARLDTCIAELYAPPGRQVNLLTLSRVAALRLRIELTVRSLPRRAGTKSKQ